MNTLQEFIENATLTLDDADLEFEPLRESADEMLARLVDLHGALKEIVECLEDENALDALEMAHKALL